MAEPILRPAAEKKLALTAQHTAVPRAANSPANFVGMAIVSSV
jgi:hypothetical protein